MEVYNHNLGSKPIEIVALGHIHFGTTETDEEFLKLIINKIKKRNAYVVLMGDLIDCGLKESPGASVYTNKLSPGEQIKEIVKLLYTIRKRILSSVIGNHELRVLKSSGIYVNDIICDSLNINNGRAQVINNIKIGKELYPIFAFHGRANGTTTESRVNQYKKMLEQVEAEIYLFGHTHDTHLRVFDKRIYKDNLLRTIKKYMIFCGNFLNYDNGYGELYGYPVMEKGCPLIKLYPNKHKIEVDLEWWKND
jgi:predicted phosphodiesterase